MAETKDKIRVGIIGCGGISNAHLPTLSKSDDVEIVGFCDLVEERAQKQAEKYKPGTPTFDHASKMLDSVEMDAAYILIPTYAHGEPERLCIAKGLHFLVEKPLHIDPNDLRQLAREVEDSGVIACAGFMNRYRDSINRARELLQDDPAVLMDGAWIGGPPIKRPGDYFANNPIGLWWPIKEKSGGQFVEQVIHTVDLARYLGGEVSEVHAYAAKGFNAKLENLIDAYTLDDAMTVSLRFESGAVGNIMGCCAARAGGGPGVFLNVWASGHTFRFTEWAHHVQIYTAGNKEPEEIKGDSEEIFRLEDRAFIEAVKTGDRTKIRCTHADGARSTLLALAANESLEAGKPVQVRY
jgi:predicted dehydrogenase